MSSSSNALQAVSKLGDVSATVAAAYALGHVAGVSRPKKSEMQQVYANTFVFSK